MSSHARIVQEIYADFGRGAVAAIVGTFADGFEFRHIGGSDIPSATDRIGKSQAARFSEEFASAVEVSAFEPQQFVEQGSSVVAIGRWAGTVRRTGRVVLVADRRNGSRSRRRRLPAG